MKENIHELIVENLKENNFLPNQINLEDYIQKIYDLSTIISIHNRGKLIAFIAYYDNDVSKMKAFISLILVDKNFLNNNIGKNLLNSAIMDLKAKGFRMLELKVRRDNQKAINFYKNFSFKIFEEDEEFLTMSFSL